MGIKIESSGQTVTAYLDGEIDHHSAREMRETIDRELESGNVKLLILDFRDVTFMDSSWNRSCYGQIPPNKVLRRLSFRYLTPLPDIQGHAGGRTGQALPYRKELCKKMIKPINEMKLTLTSRSSNESFARVAVAAFAAQLDPTVEEIGDIKTAVSEAVTNCIVHAYKETLGPIYITVGIFENRKVRIKIRDVGCGIEDVERAMEPLFTTGGEERAGLGFAVMESFTDNLKVRSRKDKGTTVTMEKIIKRR